MNIDQRSYHKLLFTLSHYTEKVLENYTANKKNIRSMNEFDQYMINSLEMAYEDITAFSFFSELVQKLVSQSTTKKESQEWIERIIKLYDLIKS